MKVVLQRSLKSSVLVNDKVVGSIDNGLVILVGFTIGDTIDDINYLVDKIINLRIFDDDKGNLNYSLLDTNGEILSISQFTLYGDTKKGRKPDFKKSLNYNEAKILYDLFNQKLKEYNIKVETGIFGEDMCVNITNDGPVTIVMESRN